MASDYILVSRAELIQILEQGIEVADLIQPAKSDTDAVERGMKRGFFKAGARGLLALAETARSAHPGNPPERSLVADVHSEPRS